MDFAQDANEFLNFTHILVASKLRFPLHRYYSSTGNQLYESCNGARAAGRPAKMQLEAHSGQDSPNFINSDIFRHRHFLVMHGRNLGPAENYYMNFLEDASMTNRKLFCHRIPSSNLAGIEWLDLTQDANEFLNFVYIRVA